MTESAFFASAAQKDCFNDLNVERYEIVGTYDNRMCDFCGDMNGQVFPMKDFRAGVTAPPFHPWCRCTTAPYFEDMQGIGERWMRDPETGKGGYVPEDMTYQEWKDIYANKASTFYDWAMKRVDKSGESGIIGLRTANGILIKENTWHVGERSAERSVKPKEIVDAILKPLNIGDVIYDQYGRPSQRFIGKSATVNVNPKTGAIPTVWRTGKRTRRKYEKGGS